ncbi:MAG: hypothetical protein ABIV07_12265 [Polaromonas sp.]
MNPSAAKAPSRFPLSQELVLSDFAALASHMTECERSRGRFFTLRAVLETLHTMTAPRLVTTGALLVLCSLGLVLLTLA